MNAKPVIPREQANHDTDAAINHYLEDDALPAALGFIDALEQAYKHISRHGASGSPRYAHTLNLPGLRSWALSHYPYLVFYTECDTHIDVWRVLHTRRDIPERMRDV